MYRSSPNKKIVLAASAFTLTLVGYFAWSSISRDPLEGYVTDIVSRGDVTQIVTVSGFIESKNTAELGFSAGGILSSVNVTEGQSVVEGQVLATLASESILAEKAQAQAAKAAAESTRAELIAGPSLENRNLSSKTVAVAKSELDRVTKIETERTESALRTLRSAGLFAVSDEDDEEAPAPTISGTYSCQNEGTYYIKVYRSASESGYSISLSGIETGTYPVSTSQAIPFGSCGLRAQFSASGQYSESNWTVEIPNTKSSLYTTNKNAYELAKTNSQNAIAAATQALTLAELQAARDNAAPRSESVARANAAIAEAEARINQIDARLNNLNLVAPFSGIITTVKGLRGENVGTAPIMKLVADNRFVLKARIPEVDITDIEVGQEARVIFDARSKESFAAKVSYISPAATEISGVTYYETELVLETSPTWLRGGLNADIEITINKVAGELRMPRRFLTEEDNNTYVSILEGSQIVQKPVSVLLLGNDGFVAIKGIDLGDTVVTK